MKPPGFIFLAQNSRDLRFRGQNASLFVAFSRKQRIQNNTLGHFVLGVRSGQGQAQRFHGEQLTQRVTYRVGFQLARTQVDFSKVLELFRRTVTYLTRPRYGGYNQSGANANSGKLRGHVCNVCVGCLLTKQSLSVSHVYRCGCVVSLTTPASQRPSIRPFLFPTKLVTPLPPPSPTLPDTFHRWGSPVVVGTDGGS
jgi:hypothetical protein